MLPVFADFLKELEALHVDFLKAIDGLPPQALDWSPGPGMNSINVLVAHTTGAQRFLIGDIVGDISSQRNRPAEFAAAGLDGAALSAMLNQALETTRATLDKLTMADFESTQPRTKDGRAFTVSFALHHALAHTANHLGHVQMARQLWEQRT